MNGYIAEAFAVDTVRQRSRNASGTQSIASQSFAGDTLRRFGMAAVNGHPTRTGVLAPTTRTPQKAEKVECPLFAFSFCVLTENADARDVRCGNLLADLAHACAESASSNRIDEHTQDRVAATRRSRSASNATPRILNRIFRLSSRPNRRCHQQRPVPCPKGRTTAARDQAVNPGGGRKLRY